MSGCDDSRDDPYHDAMDNISLEMYRIRNGARREDYGHVLENHRNIAAGWSILLGVEVAPAQVATCLAWLKLARTVRSPELKDHYVDAGNYAVIAGALALAEEETQP